MTIETSIILGLIALLFIQQAFYMWQVHKLLNKAMSGSFAEYSHTLKPPVSGFRVQTPDAEEVQTESEINRVLMGFGR